MKKINFCNPITSILDNTIYNLYIYQTNTIGIESYFTLFLIYYFSTVKKSINIL